MPSTQRASTIALENSSELDKLCIEEKKGCCVKKETSYLFPPIQPPPPSSLICVSRSCYIFRNIFSYCLLFLFPFYPPSLLLSPPKFPPDGKVSRNTTVNFTQRARARTLDRNGILPSLVACVYRDPKSITNFPD